MFKPQIQSCQQDQVPLGGGSPCPWQRGCSAGFSQGSSPVPPSPTRSAAAAAAAGSEPPEWPRTPRAPRSRAGLARRKQGGEGPFSPPPLPLLLLLISFHFIFKISLCLSHPSFSHSLSPIHSEPANGVCSNSVLLDRGCNFNK